MYHPLTSHSEHDASAAGHAQAAAHAAAVWPSRLRPQDVAWSAQPPAPQLSQRACAYWPALHTYDGMDTSSHRTQYWPEHHTAADDAAYSAHHPTSSLPCHTAALPTHGCIQTLVTCLTGQWHLPRHAGKQIACAGRACTHCVAAGCRLLGTAGPSATQQTAVRSVSCTRRQGQAW